jgi:hypothetical protein
MHDSMLELWLRLLALHLPEPNDYGENKATVEIRNRWLLASRGYFIGCVPHGMEDACATQEGREVVRHAIHSLRNALQPSPNSLDPNTLNLLGIEGTWLEPVDRRWLNEIGEAFLDLLDGRITGTVKQTDIMPGTKPYKRAACNA